MICTSFWNILVVGQLDHVEDRGNHESVDVASKIENLIDQFDSLRTRIRVELEAKPDMTVPTLLDKLTGLPPLLKKEYYDSSIKKEIPRMCRETQINKLFIIHLNPLTSFMDYGLIEYFIKKFGSDGLKKDMRSYCSEMIVFMKETTIKQLIDHLPGQAEAPPKFSLIEAKIGENASECTLEQLNTIRKRYCSELRLSEIVFHLLALLDSNSFIVQWLVPSALIKVIMKSSRTFDYSFYQECRITSFTLDGMWLFLSESEIDGMWSQINMTDTIFKTQFHTIYNQVMYELEIQEVSKYELWSCLKEQKLNKSLLTDDSSLPLMIFEMLTVIVEKFGSDCLKRVMKSYCNYVMSIDTKHLTAQQLIALSPLPSKPSKYFVIGECRIVEKASEYGLERLASFQTRFCTMVNINKLGFVIGEMNTEISTKSFTVRWLVPSALVSGIMKSTRHADHSFYQEYQITSLTLDGMWIQLSDAEIDAMWSQLHVSDTNFKVQFHTMYKQIVYELEMAQKTRNQLSSSFKKLLKCHQRTSYLLSHELLNHKLPVSVVDFRVLAAAIEGFGSDCLKSVMSSYSKYISTFLKKSTALQLITLSAIQLQPSGYSIVKCRMKEEPSQYKLDKLFEFRTEFCTIANCSELRFIMDEVNTEMSGSFSIDWLVPPAFVSGIMKFSKNVDHNLYYSYNVTSLTLDGMWLFLSEYEIDAMWSQLHMNETKFKDQFCTMHKQILYEVDRIGRSTATDKLSSYLMDQQPTLQQDLSINISKAILSPNFPISLIDFRMPAIVIELFGSDCLKRVMESYCRFMSIFVKQSTLESLIHLSLLQSRVSENFLTAECKIKGEPFKYGLEKLFKFQTRFCSMSNIDTVCFVVGEVGKEVSGSFTVSWYIPSAAAISFMKFTRNIFQSFYQEYQIISLTLDGMWIQLSNAEIDAMWSQLHVSDTNFKVQFHAMYKQIVYELEMAQKSRNQLSSSFKKLLKCHQRTSYLLSHELLNHKLPVSVVDFRVLAAAIEGFGSDCLKSVMSSYSKYMSTFLKKSTALQLITLSAIQLQPSGYSIVKCRMKEEPSQYKLDKLFEFRTEFCTIANCSELRFIMDEVNTETSGSFSIDWLVPPAFVSGMMKFSKNVDHSLYYSYNVTSLTLDGMWLFLNEVEIDAMWSQVHVSDIKFKDQFHTMCKQIVCEMKARNVLKDHLSSYFQSLNYQRQISDQLSRAVLEEEFPASFVDFGVLKTVIEEFGSDCLKRVMESYCNYMSIFTKESTVQQLINLSVLQSKHWKHFVAAKCRIMEEPSHCRLEKLLQFRTGFCAIASFNEACFIINKVNMEISSSFTVSWLVPSATISDVVVKSTRYVGQSFYQEYKINSLTLDGMWLFLSDAEIDAMWLQMYPSDFESQFLAMYKQIVYELKAQEISKNKLSSYLMDQQPKLQSKASIQLSEAFLEHAFPISVLDIRLLSIVTEKFGSDCLKSVMNSFLSVYTRESTIEQLVSLPPIRYEISVNFITVESSNTEEPSNCKLSRLLNFQARFCAIVNIEEVCFIMDKIEAEEAETSGSFGVRWHVPSCIALDLLKSANQLHPKQTKLFREMNVASLQFGGMWLYNYQLTPLGIQLRKRYQQSQGSPSPVEWIPSPTKKIFRLAMIQRERVQRGHIEDRLVRMTISGRVDDILHAKSPVELEHIFRNTLYGGEIILIEGAPGSGKSTLTVHICQRWGKGELFQQFTVVILVQLRDPAVQRAQTIADLVPVENAEEIAAELIATNGRGVLWVIDGWDELPPHLQQDSVFHKLIKAMLSECSVVVTSRPISSGDLHPVVSSRIEVLGFTPEEQRQYFTECLKGDTKALEALLEKIQENPVVQSTCYLPLNAAFIVQTFKYRDQSLPNTEYEIYLSVILSCIQRHYDREGRGHDLPRELASLDDLSRSEAVREPFQCLCELAYRGVMENKVTFSSSDLPQGSNTLSLLQAIESFLQSRKSVFYNFLHLSIQEVLSAYYITTKLSDSEQVSQFQQLFNQPRFAAVFQFYAAITKLKSPGIHQVIDRIVKAKSKPLLVSLLCCLHEAQDPTLCLYVAERLEYRLDLSDTSLSPLDCLSVSFFLSFIAGKESTVNFAQCQIGDIGAKCLTKYLSMSGYADLVTINLRNNDILVEGASHVAKLLNFIEHLHLDISGNPIGVTGTSYMFQAVRESSVLKTLVLIGGTIIADLLPVENAQEVETELRATNRRGVLWILDNYQHHLHSRVFSPKHKNYSNIECSVIVAYCHTIDEITNRKYKPLLVSLLCCLHEAQNPTLCLYVAERLEYRLDLSDTSLSPLDCLSVSFFLSFIAGKESTVNLAQCQIGDIGAECLTKYLSMSGYADLVTINLRNNDILVEGASHVAKLLNFIEHLHLDISGNPIGVTGTSYMFQAVRESSVLKTLVLIGGTIIADLLPVENAQEVETELRATNRRGVLWILDDYQRHLHSRVFPPKHNFNIEYSVIVASRRTIDEITNRKSKPLLVSLLCCLHEAQDPDLCLYVAKRLEYRLDLSRISLSPLDLHHIARMVYFIEHLRLSYNPIGDTGASLIFEAVRETATLKTLILYHCGITSRGAEDLPRALTQNISLEKLDIGDNNLGDEGISHVAEALKQNKQLKELWIGGGIMTDEGAASLASALTVNNSLNILHMGGPKGALTEDGLAIIAQSVVSNSKLVKLAIPDAFGATNDDIFDSLTPTLRLNAEVSRERVINRLPPIEIEGEYTVCCVDVSYH